MALVRLILGVVVGLVVVTLVTESLELLVVKLASGESFERLTSDEAYYFSIRNQLIILLVKLVYTTGAGILGGYLASIVGGKLSEWTLAIVLVIQVASLIWAGFVSELSATGPMWMWVSLIILVPLGLVVGYRLYEKRHKAQRM